ncbi:MAG: response regulator [Spirochaetales bacterium]
MEGQRVVIVEDESIVALDIKTHLESEGYTVPGIFATGEEAIEALSGLEADLVLSDIRLRGEMDGVETAELVKSRFELPVILLTAFGDEETLQRAKLAQPFAFILKPIDEQELRNAIVISLYRHNMERRLHEREALFSTTLESIQDGVIVTDDEFRIKFVNSVAESILQKSESELVDARLSSCALFVDLDGQPVEPTEHRSGGLELIAGSDRRLPVRLSVAPMHVQSGARSGWVIVVQDISEQLAQDRKLKEREEQLRRSQRMEAIGRLTGGIAHDFNNLLTVIMGYSKLLSEEIGELEVGNAASLREDIEGIQRASIRSAALTRQLLAFSRNQIMEPRVVDVNQIVSDMEKMLQRLVSEDVITQVDLIADPSHVHADPSQLEQVLMNLAVNARDAMPDGGRLSIRTEVQELDETDLTMHRDIRPGLFVKISVRDTGSGMSPETAEHIFEPFFTTKEPGRGTGLGLSTVYGIVAQSGGIIDLETKLGRGTTFHIYLPLHLGGGAIQEGTTGATSANEGSETVLLVEDENSVRDLLARVLRRKGYNVLVAANAGEALLLHEEHGTRIQLLVTDVVMPHMAGTKLVERISAERPDLKVLYVSAYPESYLSSEDRQSLGISYMQKPVDPTAFVQRVRQILDA